MARQINYSKRDFASLKTEQINYIKQYYPEVVQNFNDASILSVFLDLNAAIADNLNYQIDRALQETVLDYAQERQSLFNIAKTYGLKLPTKSAAVAVVEFNAQVPVYGDQEDKKYLPVIKAGTQVSNGSVAYEVLYDIDFASATNSSGNVDRTKRPIFINNKLTGYIITKTGIVVAGTSKVYTQAFTTTQSFYKITLPEDNVLSVESIIHKAGTNYTATPTEGEFLNSPNKWYQVPSLAEDNVFIEDPNSPRVDGIAKGVYEKVDRRYITEFTPNGFCQITFGAQTDLSFDILDDFMDGGNFSLKSFLRNGSLGLAPITNTTMFVKYRIGGGVDSNTGVGTITDITRLNVVINGPDQNINSTVQASIGVNNTTPAVGGSDEPTIEELRNYIAYNFSAQNRAVTLNDYKALIMSMPSVFGSPAKTSITQRQNKIEIGVLTYDANGAISNVVSSLLMENIAAYLSKYRMINDYVIVKPAEVVDLGFEVGVLVETGQQIQVSAKITNIVKNEFTADKANLGKSYSVGEMIKKITQVDGVLNVNYVKAYNKTGVGYSANTTKQTIIDTATGEIDITNNYIIVEEYQMINIIKPDVDIRVIPTIATGIS
jgi:phage-related baseplate assembly protein